MKLTDMLKPEWINKADPYENLRKALDAGIEGGKGLIPESLDNEFYLLIWYRDELGEWHTRPATDEEIRIHDNRYVRVKDEHGKTLLMRVGDLNWFIDDDWPERKVLEE